MATHISHALSCPIRNARYTVLPPFLDSSGVPTDPTGPDTQLSTDGGVTFSAAAEEVTTGGGKGGGMFTFTGAETNHPAVFAYFGVASGPEPTLMTVGFPSLAIVASGTLSAGSAGGGTLGGALAYNVAGCFLRTTGGTGGGGTGGANNQARKIVTYNTSTGVFTVDPNWETTPSTDTTYDVLAPEGVTLEMILGATALDVSTPEDVAAAVLSAAAVTPIAATVAGFTASDVGAIKTKTDFLPSATAGAAGGVFIAGTNAATTITTGLTTHLIGTVDTVTTATNLTNAPTAGDLTAAMKTSVTTAATAATPIAASVTAAVAITSHIKKNQALAKFQFLMTDSTNHNPITGKTVTCTRAIDSGTQAAGTLANVTEGANGTYLVDFGAADLNGNVILLRATASGCDDTFERIITQP